MLHSPEVYFQPMTCQQCEQGAVRAGLSRSARPCTAMKGLNQMVYNRCIGTRYCSNNCPYKVRSASTSSTTPTIEEIPVKKMLYNPEVTIRGRGVMEKCSCTAYSASTMRARRPKSKVTSNWRTARSVTACHQACPTEAIVFGNISDRNSKVYQLKDPASQLRCTCRPEYPSAHDLSGARDQPEPGHRFRNRHRNGATRWIIQ